MRPPCYRAQGRAGEGSCSLPPAPEEGTQIMPNSKPISGRAFAASCALVVLAVLGLGAARVNPGAGNAALVCGGARIGGDDETLSGRGGKPAYPTNYYRLSSELRGKGLALGVAEGSDEDVILRPVSDGAARRWLFTVVGAGLYQISTCVDGQPRCLELASQGEDDRGARLAACTPETYGDQVWWSKETRDAASTLGNDGLGFLSCLGVVGEGASAAPLKLEPCRHSDPAHLWRIERAR